ncbi:hypothetical protein SD37_41475 [Amycolatopsis orientalis]|uniref:DUF4276 domain-containing protein n=1 Tax=Amycolatopsis orientalis TaxID=31958 RepID=A0A193CAD4_AMYOR|nr:DUF4276 family protein [Amycolatopsis orientalis]ANN21414.1 hypothetical protein SD37_41475 [Amycolatopsis orientalis]
MTAEYRHLHLLVEGQTEEIVVDSVLEPYLQDRGWTITKSIVTTKRPAVGPASRGGVSSWARLENEIRLLLRNSDIHTLTILFDYYGFPADSPGMRNRPSSSAYDRVEHVEKSLVSAISDTRFVPHLVLHELETWVFAAAEQLGWLFSGTGLAERLQKDVDGAGGPELVNDGLDTAPSKRLARYCDGYSKTNDGPLAIADLGIDALRSRCPHMDSWLSRLDARLG